MNFINAIGRQMDEIGSLVSSISLCRQRFSMKLRTAHFIVFLRVLNGVPFESVSPISLMKFHSDASSLMK